MSITKTVFVSFSLKLKTSFFCQLDSLFTFEGPKRECCKLSKSWKNTRKSKSILNVMDITLQTLHYGHHILHYIMDNDFHNGNNLLGEINATCIPILFKFITTKFAVFLTKH